MIRKISAVSAAAALFWVLQGCDIFMDEIGHEGEPCSTSGICTEELVCNFGICTPPVELGEACDLIENDKHGRLDPCASPAWCIDGYCTEAGGQEQPCIPYDLYNGSRTYEYIPCNDDLECIDGVCL